MKIVANYSIRSFKNKKIIYAWLLVGLLDGAAAIINYLIKGGKHPEKIFNFIASGVFGQEGLTGGVSMVILGIFFHLLIAFIWTFLFFLAYSKISAMRKNRLITGIVYGIIIWAIMNTVILPLSNTPPIPFKIKQAIIAVLILIVAIGLPLSFIANKQFIKERL